MTSLRYLGGPLDGQTYPLEQGQPVPTEIRHTSWRGHYEYLAPHPKSITRFTPHFAWRGK